VALATRGGGAEQGHSCARRMMREGGVTDFNPKAVEFSVTWTNPLVNRLWFHI
jgi:hypothetical protein